VTMVRTSSALLVDNNVDLQGGHGHHHPRRASGALFDYRKWRTIGLPASVQACNQAADRTRTDDPVFTRDVLYQPSHGGVTPMSGPPGPAG
jgi:hypothetical protein